VVRQPQYFLATKNKTSYNIYQQAINNNKGKKQQSTCGMAASPKKQQSTCVAWLHPQGGTKALASVPS